jgi:hypothetical protein
MKDLHFECEDSLLQPITYEISTVSRPISDLSTERSG